MLDGVAIGSEVPFANPGVYVWRVVRRTKVGSTHANKSNPLSSQARFGRKLMKGKTIGLFTRAVCHRATVSCLFSLFFGWYARGVIVVSHVAAREEAHT